MKTLEELYNEVIASEELKSEFLQAFQAQETSEAVLKKYGCDATFEELQAFLKDKQDNQALVSDEDLKAIAGGKGEGIFFSVVTVGVYCGIMAGISGAVSTAKECLGM